MNDQRQPDINIRGLHKAFGTLEILRGIDLDAHEGDVISILGASRPWRSWSASTSS
jgi:ABC-type histidine transport system ATPase subunit